MVFMSHNAIETGVPFLKHIFTTGGRLGVECFFVLSGFILTYNYQRLLIDKKISVKQFYKARFARIYPLHFLMLIVTVVATPSIVLNVEYLMQFVTNLTLTQSFIPQSKFYFAFNAPSWSISDEMFFYITFPFIVCFAAENVKTFRTMLLAVAGFILILPFFIAHDVQFYLFCINPVFRLVDFCLGIALFQFCSQLEKYHPRLLNNVIGGVIEAFSLLLLIVFYCASYYIPPVYRFAMWYWIPVGGVIGMFYLSRNGAVSRVLNNKIFVKLGEISFGFYLIHQWFGWKFHGFLAKINVELDYIYSLSIVFVITLVSSYVSYKWFEQPVNRWLKRL
jgi:peptidoglycan/LPS O-acetylase OafA/YrhL